MKQRLAPPPQRKSTKELTADETWTVWQSPIGWTGLLASDEGLRRVLMGHRSVGDLEAAMRAVTPTIQRQTGHTDLCDRLDAYFAGTPDSFEDVAIATLWSTPFQRAVITALRQVRCGETTTYAELAAKAGRPGAARAVGQVMATNPVPIVVPCHRVLASNGKLGGFSAPTGLILKQWLLDLEAPARPNKPR